MTASMRDVARRAGVSVKTVSNVVNGYPYIADGTRRRVQRAIDELSYRPNLSARRLRGGNAEIIALAVPELAMPYFAELAGEVVRAAGERSWTVLVDQTDGDRERERLVVSGIRPQLMDGLIYSPLALSGREVAQHQGATPLVLLGERVAGGGADHVAIDNVAAARAATDHLVDAGRQRIAAIGYQRTSAGETARLRARGYEQALRSAGRRVRRELQAVTTYYHRDDGAAGMSWLLTARRPPDAVFCFSDLLALGALRTLRQRGLRVPDDVAVVGFDDIEEATFAVPSLTSVRPDKEEIARVAVAFLLDRLHGADRPPREYTASFRLVVRESSGGLPG